MAQGLLAVIARVKDFEVKPGSAPGMFGRPIRFQRVIFRYAAIWEAQCVSRPVKYLFSLNPSFICSLFPEFCSITLICIPAANSSLSSVIVPYGEAKLGLTRIRCNTR